MTASTRGGAASHSSHFPYNLVELGAKHSVASN
jgi:hypothetical protein